MVLAVACGEPEVHHTSAYLVIFYRFYRNFVFRTARELDIPIIDLHREVFTAHPDPLALFPRRKARHYNAEGYRLVANAIHHRLARDKISRD